MLGRKQSLKGEPILADYGPEEAFNESAEIEWVNKVNKNSIHQQNFSLNIYIFIVEMGSQNYAVLCSYQPGIS